MSSSWGDFLRGFVTKGFDTALGKGSYASLEKAFNVGKGLKPYWKATGLPYSPGGSSASFPTYGPTLEQRDRRGGGGGSSMAYNIYGEQIPDEYAPRRRRGRGITAHDLRSFRRVANLIRKYAAPVRHFRTHPKRGSR